MALDNPPRPRSRRAEPDLPNLGGAAVPPRMTLTLEGFTWPLHIRPNNGLVVGSAFAAFGVGGALWLALTIAVALLASHWQTLVKLSPLVLLLFAYLGGFAARQIEHWRGKGVLELKQQRLTFTSLGKGQTEVPVEAVRVDVSNGVLWLAERKLPLHDFARDELAWLRDELERIQTAAGSASEVPEALRQLSAKAQGDHQAP